MANLDSISSVMNSRDVNSGLCVASIPSFLNTFPSSYTLSNPPIISFFKNSSGAILSSNFYRSIQLSVSNGLARAPPAWALNIGVSTSRKLFSSRQFLRNFIILALVWKNLLTSALFTIKSRQRFWKRYSESFRVFLWLQFIMGRFMSQGERRLKPVAIMVNSPAAVLPGQPSMPTIAPLLQASRTSLKVYYAFFLSESSKDTEQNANLDQGRPLGPNQLEYVLQPLGSGFDPCSCLSYFSVYRLEQQPIGARLSKDERVLCELKINSSDSSPWSGKMSALEFFG